MRISDWSSDVCSSDLHCYTMHTYAGIQRLLVGFQTRKSGQQRWVNIHQAPQIPTHKTLGEHTHKTSQHNPVGLILIDQASQGFEIGRASCRERVCQYVSIWVVAVSLKKKKKKK